MQRSSIFLYTSICYITLLSSFLTAQTKKSMTSDVFTTWKRISNEQLSKDGKQVAYELGAEQKDPSIVLHTLLTKKDVVFDRASRLMLALDGSYLHYNKSAAIDNVKGLRRKKTKKEDLPKDTLVVYHTSTGETMIFPHVTDVKSSRYYNTLIAFKKDIPDYKKDTLLAKKETKKQSKENGTHLIIYKPGSKSFDTIKYVKEYILAEKSPILYIWTTGDSSNHSIIQYNVGSNQRSVIMAEKLQELKLFTDENGQKLSALISKDTTKAEIKDRSLWLYTQGEGKIKKVLDNNHGILPKGWHVPEFATVRFPKNSNTVIFGLAPKPILQDTNKLEEEIVKVEVWHSEDPVLYTMQEVRLEQDRKKVYNFAYNEKTSAISQLSTPQLDQLITNREGKVSSMLVSDRLKYGKCVTWEGGGRSDVYKIDSISGTRKMIAEKLDGFPLISASGKYAAWFSGDDQGWYKYSFANDKVDKLVTQQGISFGNELNDVPARPSEYGLAGWTKDDKEVFIYDRYDIWMVNPQTGVQKNITNGRTSKMVYRLIDLDSEKEEVDTKDGLLLNVFDETTKESGYATLNLTTGKIDVLTKGPYQYHERPIKAENSTEILTTRQNFQTFPDLLITDKKFAAFSKITNANPQQSEYNWGTIELLSWKNKVGEALTGLVVKPENFDPNKKYPLLVNFYERSSDELYGYRAPAAGRSSINYSYYASKGYIIFNPDITYNLGYPGESCYEDLMSGVDALIAKGSIDTTRMGLQGHSWGGYQVSYLLTKTNRFKCAESGAPVVNMVSAYGGIRWESGRSRMFQYEKTQSRIGQTLWENPNLYLSNRPIFGLDKQETPVLILHNDEDGAVPWYQGIEYYMALRRLNKKAWLLNYNGEPHWPVKWQNRLDFNIRMEQFFDHYLMGKPMPDWMQRGIPVLEKSINSGY
jgi:dipeptidyl aminopeptidase/acylaminoacyl peptidase